jgi:predicted HTH domain antitoxin
MLQPLQRIHHLLRSYRPAQNGKLPAAGAHEREPTAHKSATRGGPIVGPRFRSSNPCNQSFKNNADYYYEKVHKPMGACVLKIPEDIVAALRIPPDEVEDELHKELALALYQRGMLSSGKAAALSGLTRQQFEDLLGKRKIVRHYGAEDLEEDLEYARSGL